MAAQQFANLDRRLRSVAGLSDGPARALSTLAFYERRLKAGECLYPPGPAVLPCYILLEGAANRFKLRSDSTRAIVAFELPGDILNLEALLLGRTDCGVNAASDCVVAVVDRTTMTDTWKSEPGLEAALWRYAFVKSAALEEWLLNIGKRSPLGRIAHLLMEIRARLNSVSSDAVESLVIHATMQDIADAMGLQEVVATRIVHRLVSQGVIRRLGDTIVINDADRLARIGEFRPDYLHLAS